MEEAGAVLLYPCFKWLYDLPYLFQVTFRKTKMVLKIAQDTMSLFIVNEGKSSANLINNWEQNWESIVRFRHPCLGFQISIELTSQLNVHHSDLRKTDM